MLISVIAMAPITVLPPSKTLLPKVLFCPSQTPAFLCLPVLWHTPIECKSPFANVSLTFCHGDLFMPFFAVFILGIIVSVCYASKELDFYI